MSAAAEVLLGASLAAPQDYLSHASLAESLATAIVAALQAAGALSIATIEHAAAAKAALGAAGHLLARAGQHTASIIRPGLLVKGLSVLKQAAQGWCSSAC